MQSKAEGNKALAVSLDVRANPRSNRYQATRTCACLDMDVAYSPPAYFTTVPLLVLHNKVSCPLLYERLGALKNHMLEFTSCFCVDITCSCMSSLHMVFGNFAPFTLPFHCNKFLTSFHLRPLSKNFRL